MGLPPKGVTRRFGRLKKATNSLPITRGDLCPLPVTMNEEAPPLNLYLFLATLVLRCCWKAWAFSSCCKQGLLCSCGVWASHCDGFSCWLRRSGVVALQHVGFRGFPGGSVVKNPPANAKDAGDVGLIPG